MYKMIGIFLSPMLWGSVYSDRKSDSIITHMGRNDHCLLFTSSGAVSRLFLEEIPLICICGVIIFVLGTFFSRLFTRKIEELTANMDQVNHGSRQVVVSSEDVYKRQQ